MALDVTDAELATAAQAGRAIEAARKRP